MRSSVDLVQPQGDSFIIDNPSNSTNQDHGHVASWNAQDDHLGDGGRMLQHKFPQSPAVTTPTMSPSSGMNNSILDTTNFEGLSEQFDEHEMNKRLAAVESSFLQNGTSIHSYDEAAHHQHSDIHEDVPVQQPGAAYDTPSDVESTRQSLTNKSSSLVSAPNDHDSSHGVAETDFENMQSTRSTPPTFNRMSSSPTAAAVARTLSRTTASSNARHNAGDEHHLMQPDAMETSAQGTRSHKLDTNNSMIHSDSDDESMSTIFITSQDVRGGLNNTAGRTSGHHLARRQLSPGRPSRPRFLSNRGTSQRSSTSSIPRSDQSNMSFGIDYALATGGAAPDNTLSRNSSYLQARSHSLSDLASENGDFREDTGILEQEFAILTEEESTSRPSTAIKIEETDPETPRGKVSMAVPTDTVLARHVSKIVIPDSIARGYRDQFVKSPSKPLASAPAQSGKNMTLKEQSSSIERLSKENFDLKLKVMFLSDRLDKLSEEGVRETITENVELKTALANLQRDNKILRKKNKELEAKSKEASERPNTARSGTSSNFDHGQQWSSRGDLEDHDEELIYLREKIEEYLSEINHLQAEAQIREAEKRKMAETVQSMSFDKPDEFKNSDELAVWRDQYESESARRLEAEEHNRKLREENFNLRSESANTLNRPTNVYSRNGDRQISSSRPQSRFSERYDTRNGTFSAASTLVEDLRRETEQLRHENTELRREVGAQTSMLTSRNREKERLYQEIEELKLLQRRYGGSAAGDSILERSASRAHIRSNSRASSIRVKHNGMDDAERDEYEQQLSSLRDAMTKHRLERQELEESLNQTEADFEQHLEEKEGMIADMQELAATIETLEAEVQDLHTERDELLQQNDQLGEDYHQLKSDAEQRLEDADVELEEKLTTIDKLNAELADKAENFAALQNEMQSMNEVVIRLENGQKEKMDRIMDLESEVEASNREYEEMQRQLDEVNGKLERLTIQQENSTGEISFLREEQESDKVKIGALEASNASLEKSLADEMRHVQDLTEHHDNERKQWTEVDGKNKEQTSDLINSLNREIESSKDDARKAHGRAQTHETESVAWQARLQEFENNLGVALGVVNAPRAALLKNVEKVQREMERSAIELADTRNKLNEQMRMVKHRDTLLETHILEHHKTKDALDKEQQLHRGTKHQFDQFQKQNAHNSRTVAQQETRMLELEASKAAERKKLIQLENAFKEQLVDRNQLLLVIWNRLSALCGTEWANNNSIINGRALPTLEAIMTMLPGFSKNLFAAVKCIETIVGNFKTRVKAIERDMMKEIHNLEMTLEARTKKLNHLDLVIKSGGLTHSAGLASPGNQIQTKAELVKLRDANIMLKQELANLRNVNMSPRTKNPLFDDGSPSPSPSIPMGPGGDMFRTSKIPNVGSGATSNGRQQGPSRLERMASSASLATQKALVRSPSRAEDGRDSIRFSPARSSFDKMQAQPLTAGSESDALVLGDSDAAESSALTHVREPERTRATTAEEGSNSAGEQRWLFRLKEMERRLKLEREQRLLDRNGARQRLEDAAKVERELRAEIDRSRYRESNLDGEVGERRRLKESAFD